MFIGTEGAEGGDALMLNSATGVEWNEYHSIMASEVQRCVAGEISAQEACDNIKDGIDDLH